MSKTAAHRFNLSLLYHGDPPIGCLTPCLLPLSPGILNVKVSGPAAFEREIILPREPSTVTIRKARPDFAIAGGALLAAAVGFLLAPDFSHKVVGSQTIMLVSSLATAGPGLWLLSQSFAGIDVEPQR